MKVIGRAVLSGSESDRQITAALMTLSQEWRRVVCYADVEGFPHKEIAEMVNTPVPIAVSRLHRGRQRLRTALFVVAIQRGFALEHTRDHALCLGASQ
jgi:RNA polymerase sigma-70 factor (ECF subfamily)